MREAHPYPALRKEEIYENKKNETYRKEKTADPVGRTGSVTYRGSGCRSDAKRSGLCGGEDVGREYHRFLRAESWRQLIDKICGKGMDR